MNALRTRLLYVTVLAILLLPQPERMLKVTKREATRTKVSYKELMTQTVKDETGSICATWFAWLAQYMYTKF